MLKRKFLISAMLIASLLAVTLSGCTFAATASQTQAAASEETPMAQSEAPVAVQQSSEPVQNAVVQNEMQGGASASAEDEIVYLNAGGTFVATVWGFVPEFTNLPQNQIAVVLSEFQSSLFIAYIDADLGEQLEIEGTYAFETPEIYVASLPRSQAQELYAGGEGSISATELCGDVQVFITSVREPAEDEGGLASPYLSYYIVE